ncbi:MAG: OmpA family protein, partial [Gammaproteobacteria bacterium]|nr:OmpA family protein [Gammaproteobacteria bacterium]
MNPIKNSMMMVMLSLLVMGCATKTVELSDAEVMQNYPDIKELKRLLATAKKSDANNLAPQGYQKANQLFTQAFDLATTQKDGSEAIAQQGLSVIRQALTDTKSSKSILQTVLDARQKAIIATAHVLYPQDFEKVEKRLRLAANAIELNKIEQAKDKRAELIKEYAALELIALKETITELAEVKIAEAKNADANKYAPETFKLAEEELALSLDVLDAGRTQVLEANNHARLAVFYANKSMQITELVRFFKRQDFSEEDKVLWYQQQLAIINDPFKKELALDQPNEIVVKELQSQISSALNNKTDRDMDLYTANEKITILEERIQAMEANHQQVVAELNEKMQGQDASRRMEIEKIKENNRKAQARYQKIQSMFTEEEATVFRQGNNVLLETHAFNFKIGGSEIDAKNYGLLEKIMNAIEVFDRPNIMIMGHTDSTGSDALNLQLSQKRAETVTAFLQKIAKFEPDRIKAKGYGESRPVASNETREGRERNR